MSSEPEAPDQSSDFRSAEQLRLWPRMLRAAAVSMTLSAAAVFGQEADPQDAQQTALEVVAAEDIEAALKQVDDSKELDDATKSRAKTLTRKRRRH